MAQVSALVHEQEADGEERDDPVRKLAAVHRDDKLRAVDSHRSRQERWSHEERGKHDHAGGKGERGLERREPARDQQGQAAR